MLFWIQHGSFGTRDGNWFKWLDEELTKLGHQVLRPQMPIDNWASFTKGQKTKQNLNSWLETFKKECLPVLSKAKEVVFVGHSLAPLFLLHTLDHSQVIYKVAIFVSPFLEIPSKDVVDAWQIDEVNQSFYGKKFDRSQIENKIKLSYVLRSDNDPYVKPEIADAFAKTTNSSITILPGAGHISKTSGFTELPVVLKLCSALSSVAS